MTCSDFCTCSRGLQTDLRGATVSTHNHLVPFIAIVSFVGQIQDFAASECRRIFFNTENSFLYGRGQSACDRQGQVEGCIAPLRLWAPGAEPCCCASTSSDVAEPYVAHSGVFTKVYITLF